MDEGPIGHPAGDTPEVFVLMSRWRPPRPGSSPYITARGLDRLKKELKQLWIDRRDVVSALTAAAAEGDRSENAEYIYRKKQLREMDRRIRYLGKRVDEVTPVAGPPSDSGKVFFGARVTVEDADGTENCYRIVGADEIDSKRNWISVDSPLARGLLGKALDDQAEIETPGGTRCLSVVEIDYGAVDSDA